MEERREERETAHKNGDADEREWVVPCGTLCYNGI